VVHLITVAMRPGKAPDLLTFWPRSIRTHSFVRDFVPETPTHKLVEVNITASDAGTVMANAFGLNEEWGAS
jgi:hypothetical protein